MQTEKYDTCRLRYICERQAEFICKKRDHLDYIPDNEPTIEMAPIVHAKWIILNRNSNGNTRPVCSACNTYRLYAWADYTRCNFCPNCGAKMDLEDEDD